MNWYTNMMSKRLAEFQDALYIEDYKLADKSIASYHDYKNMAEMLGQNGFDKCGS